MGSAVWRKSTRSLDRNACVELAVFADGVGVRDSQDPDGVVLDFSFSSWSAFVSGVKLGEFDCPQRR